MTIFWDTKNGIEYQQNGIEGVFLNCTVNIEYNNVNWQMKSILSKHFI